MTQVKERVRDTGIGERVARIFSDGLLKVVETFPLILRSALVPPVAAPESPAAARTDVTPARAPVPFPGALQHSPSGWGPWVSAQPR